MLAVVPLWAGGSTAGAGSSGDAGAGGSAGGGTGGGTGNSISIPEALVVVTPLVAVALAVAEGRGGSTAVVGDSTAGPLNTPSSPLDLPNPFVP